jgi:ribosomal protein S15P/S13E
MANKKKSYKGKKQYGIYAMQGRRLKNKMRTLKRHLRKLPKDLQAKAALRALKVNT